ncbi:MULTISPECIES: 3-phenylpropionate/cinnamic acid dioxygenase ferredoxin subunit [Pseudomonas]|uniref:3-phenylpropionate/cinnamic acid dioxygenase ferredoxin subunit n=1 Tax=Pseudomonas TaxID=286 RepID=UPI001AE14B19|nr:MULTISPECIES: 3-phenylpropionate/cinnamic acid dioxygenase ferredoxin subunit [unclassified Pseudomonas]WHH50525.1 bifunctional 3-phenylpropionate/cinnamic acid dioxygenase ferredoxin subunit [Pseudomonas sp. Ap32]HDS1695670.1 bifunctional 3-phenylpropionate/cinnamic acid dioxygenase ferredoxin subunit [Pseudomonas putida]MBP2270915.1 3-phenylpropionate/trans-cinnamate dioxygenase ferredoxin subunit [Pseudomonas sp. BP6]MBP2290115.1 3-phenylpropionate/trans-cinnamate dioxygenase ferredoxin s
MTTFSVCETHALADGEAVTVQAADRLIAVFNVGGEFYALDDRCSHGNASMSEGYIEDDATVECPLHAARFCLKSGAALCQPATEPLRTYPVSIVDDIIHVVLEDAA